MTQNTVITRIKKVFGKENISGISKVKNPSSKGPSREYYTIQFTYKGNLFMATGFPDNKIYKEEYSVDRFDKKTNYSSYDIWMAEKLDGTNVEDVKEITKKIKKKATVLPKKTMKLESTLNEDKQDELYDKIKEVGWNKNIKKYNNKGKEVGFTFKGVRFRATFFNNSKNPSVDFYFDKDNYMYNGSKYRSEEYRKSRRLVLEVRGLIKSFGIEKAKEKIKEIRDTSIKLPKKKMKLEDFIEQVSKQ